jgi:hypothetical protein
MSFFLKTFADFVLGPVGAKRKRSDTDTDTDSDSDADEVQHDNINESEELGVVHITL